MGKGDMRTTKGKRYAGSYGNSRPHRVAVSAGATSAKVPVAKKTAAKKKA